MHEINAQISLHGVHGKIVVRHGGYIGYLEHTILIIIENDSKTIIFSLLSVSSIIYYSQRITSILQCVRCKLRHISAHHDVIHEVAS